MVWVRHAEFQKFCVFLIFRKNSQNASFSEMCFLLNRLKIHEIKGGKTAFHIFSFNKSLKAAY